MTSPWNPVHTAPTASVVEVRVDGQAHTIRIPAEWSGGLTVTVNVHRGRASHRILIGRSVAIMLSAKEDQKVDSGAASSDSIKS